jgi:hypothetical protein
LSENDPDPVIYKLFLRLNQIIDAMDAKTYDEKLHSALLANYGQKAN